MFLYYLRQFSYLKSSFILKMDQKTCFLKNLKEIYQKILAILCFQSSVTINEASLSLAVLTHTLFRLHDLWSFKNRNTTAKFIKILFMAILTL